jgi:uncharacterized protein YdbL (DUF1318 family)
MSRRTRSRLAVFVAAVLALALVAATPAFAQSLDQLRASGAVGERYDGYAQALDSSARAFVDQVNAKRRKIYAEDAAQTGASTEQVGRVFAQQIFSKAPPGTRFLQENGAWITK